MMMTDRLDLMDTETVRRLRRTADEHSQALLVGIAISVAVSLLTYFLVRTVIRRRRRTFWERTLDYLENLGQVGQGVAGRMKELYEDNVDTDAIAKQVGTRIKNIQRDMGVVNDTVANLRAKSRKLADRVAD